MTPTLTHYKHPILGCLQLHFNDDVLIKVDLPYPHLYQEANALLPQAWQEQFDAYFTGRLKSFEGDILIDHALASLITQFAPYSQYVLVWHTIVLPQCIQSLAVF